MLILIWYLISTSALGKRNNIEVSLVHSAKHSPWSRRKILRKAYRQITTFHWKRPHDNNLKPRSLWESDFLIVPVKVKGPDIQGLQCALQFRDTFCMYHVGGYFNINSWCQRLQQIWLKPQAHLSFAEDLEKGSKGSIGKRLVMFEVRLEIYNLFSPVQNRISKGFAGTAQLSGIFMTV